MTLRVTIFLGIPNTVTSPGPSPPTAADPPDPIPFFATNLPPPRFIPTTFWTPAVSSSIAAEPPERIAFSLTATLDPILERATSCPCVSDLPHPPLDPVSAVAMRGLPPDPIPPQVLPLSVHPCLGRPPVPLPRPPVCRFSPCRGRPLKVVLDNKDELLL
ncbi:hypothetical protein SETIT_5G346800v2 [Setaria italica]|uniref:Uncharacterized protein n=1 Tax=Setaria italica TaxID=4555 RepID=A0A368RC61_SETIT|nr:hypothetical protein SETIT_5G346800v2 [Setaria italica]